MGSCISWHLLKNYSSNVYQLLPRKKIILCKFYYIKIKDFKTTKTKGMLMFYYCESYSPVFNYPRWTRCGWDIATLLWFRVSVRASVRGPCERDRNSTVVCLFSKLGRHGHYDKKMNFIDCGGQRSKVKVKIDIYWNKIFNAIETKPLCASSSNLADMFAIVRGWNVLVFEVRVQRSIS